MGDLCFKVHGNKLLLSAAAIRSTVPGNKS